MKTLLKRVMVLSLAFLLLFGGNASLLAEASGTEGSLAVNAERYTRMTRAREEANRALAELTGRDDVPQRNVWTERQIQEQNRQRAWDEAVESYKEYQMTDSDSTFYDIFNDGLNKSFVEIAKKEAGEIFGEATGPVVEFVDACRKIVENVIKATEYQSEHEHGIFKWTDYACEWYSVITNAYVDVMDALDMKILTLPVQIMNYVVGFARDFFNLPEVVEVLNNSNPWFMQILDWLFDFLENNPFDEIPDSRDFLDWWIRMCQWINCYKPNIYLYGEAGTELSFTFTEPQLLTTTIPEYDQVWNVVLEEDGQLTVDGDGDFSFLFYESVTLSELMQEEAGFVIEADRREEQFREILTQYGFNAAETADFIEFWMEKLETGEDYVMYPQLTETVDAAMPIVVESEQTIESYYRIWFYFVEADDVELSDIAEPEIVPVRHDGFTLIEWGGLVA